VVQGGGALIKATRVPGIGEWESVKVEVMAELMAKGAQARSERRDLLADRRSHPEADGRIRVIIAEKFRCRIFPDAKGPASTRTPHLGCGSPKRWPTVKSIT
jgi:hypothetical protein